MNYILICSNSIDYDVVQFYYGVVLSYFACRFLIYAVVVGDCVATRCIVYNCFRTS